MSVQKSWVTENGAIITQQHKSKLLHCERREEPESWVKLWPNDLVEILTDLGYAITPPEGE